MLRSGGSGPSQVVPDLAEFTPQRRTGVLVRDAAISLGVALALAALAVVIALMEGRPADALPATAILGGTAGLVASALTLAVLAAFPQRATAPNVRLLELASPGHPLLKRLMLDAPGTYTHSVLVGHLAEQAAEEIGAYPLLARVGGYCHDVGKLHRPEYFCENQMEVPNPHEATSPIDSAGIITAHVADGLMLADAYDLPESVREIIRQHHGTSLVRYFYAKAFSCQGAPTETEYRYEGERPTTREAALVMLADIAEAAVRCIRTPTNQRVEAVVRQVVEQRVADGQLEESGIRDADLEKVIRVYARMLQGMTHPRVDYPPESERAANERERV